MNNKQYKVVDNYGNINTLYTNDAYDIMHIKSPYNNPYVNVNYKTDDINMVNIQLLRDLIKTCNKLNDIIIVINELVRQNLISIEVYNYLCSFFYNLENEKVIKKS